MLTAMSIKLTVLKTNGVKGDYHQVTAKLALEVVNKLKPRELFTRGTLFLGNGNPFTLLNPDRIACIEVETSLPLKSVLPPGMTFMNQVIDRAAFMALLDKRWGQWRKLEKGGPASVFEALVHFELEGGWEQYVHVSGKPPNTETEAKVIENLLALPVLCVQRAGGGYNYINPSNIIRARIYHSNIAPFRPVKLLPLDHDDI